MRVRNRSRCSHAIDSGLVESIRRRACVGGADEGGGPSDGSVGLSGRDAEGVLSAAKPGQFGNSYRLVLSLALSFFFLFCLLRLFWNEAAQLSCSNSLLREEAIPTTMRDDGDAPGIAALVVRFPSGHTQRLSVFFARTHTFTLRLPVVCARPPVFIVIFLLWFLFLVAFSATGSAGVMI